MRIDDRKEKAMINGVGSCLIPGAEAGQGDYRNGRFYSVKRTMHRTPLTTTLSTAFLLVFLRRAPRGFEVFELRSTA